MENIFNILLGRYECFLLILIRTSGIFIVSPFFSSQNVPIVLKAGLSFVLSFILSTFLEIDLGAIENAFIILIFKELMVGLIIGFIAYAFFSTFYVIGQITDMKIGFGMVNVIDPQHRAQVPIMGNFYYILAFLLLLALNGHHRIIDALVDSYESIPIGSFIFDMEIGFLLIRILSKSFIIGFQLSVPVVGIIFLTDLLLGILARTIPQMNVFVIGLPLKILVGLIFISISIPMFYAITTGVFNNAIEEIYYFLKG